MCFLITKFSPSLSRANLAMTPLALAIIMSGFASLAFAYGVPTHERLTRAAVAKSVIITDPGFMGRLGLGAIATAQFQSFSGIIPMQNGAMSVENLIAYGARYEDERTMAAPPHIAFYHFYDPQFSPPEGRGLTTLGVAGYPSPDWILETRSLTFPYQYYSYSKALDQLYLAFTAASPVDRSDAFGRVFQSLGHMVHHIQDMGQPQHVRNEPHLDFPYPFAEAAFEAQANADLDETTISGLVSAKNYPVPSFKTSPALKKATDYWYSSAPSFVGMAEFTAKNFVTYNTGYEYVREGNSWVLKGSPGFPFPNGFNQPSQSAKEFKNLVREETTETGVRISKNTTCLSGSIYDGFYPAASTQQILACGTIASRFSPNAYRYFNWNRADIWRANHSVLIPRIVSFSAGLINHFFRGQVNISNKDGTSWKIANESGEATSGVYTVLSEDVNGTRRQVQQFTLAMAGLGSADVNFNPPDDTVKLVVAFSGMLGEEAGMKHGRVVDFKKVDSNVSISVDPGPISSGSSVLMTATIGGNAPSGTVQFYVDGIARGGVVSLSPSGQSSLQSGALTSGYHRITAKYSGDARNKAKLSTEAGVTVSPPAIPCQGTLTFGGGTGTTKRNMDMGSVPGNAVIKFDPFMIADRMDVTAVGSGKSLYSTNGLVSAEKTANFYFDPAAHGGNRNIEIKVTGNNDVNTGWNVVASCPGASQDPPRFKVTFGVNYPALQPTQSCSTRRNYGIWIDNEYFDLVGYVTKSKYLTDGGKHYVRAVVQGSWPSYCGGIPYFDAGAGKISFYGDSAIVSNKATNPFGQAN